jgi:single-stranded-DNA-specific exonuclease
MRAASGTFAEFGGHAAAGGFTVLDTEVFFLEDRLVEAHAKLEQTAPTAEDLSARADAELAPEEATLAYLLKVERLAPFGMQNPKPVFLLRNVVVREVSRFGKSEEHLKLKLLASEGNGRTIDAVTFFAKGAVARAAEALSSGTRANLLAHLERDAFSRANPIRLRLLDIRLV